MMTVPHHQLSWFTIFFKGGALVLAVGCIVAATRKEARGPFKWLLWILAVWLVLLEVAYWFAAK